MAPLTLDDRLAAAPDVIVREIEGELVLLSLDRAEYFGLNPTGTRVWHWLGESLALGEVADRLAREFGIAVEQARADVLALAGDLIAQGLVVVQASEEAARE